MSDERATSDVDRRLGQRVRARRLELAMSQEALAHLLGVTFQQVQKYEKGVNRIAASRLLQIAGALNMSVAAFFQGLPNGGNSAVQQGPGDVQEVLASPEGVQLLTLFTSIRSIGIRRRVVDLVRAIVESPA